MAWMMSIARYRAGEAQIIEVTDAQTTLVNQRAALYLKIDRAAKTWFLLKGSFPDSLEDLVKAALLSPADLKDPEGHPLELSYFPAGVTPQAWRDAAPGVLFLGVDHSGIAVSDVDASLAFYTGVLGLSIAARQVNKGLEQDRLDGLAPAAPRTSEPSARVSQVSRAPTG